MRLVGSRLQEGRCGAWLGWRAVLVLTLFAACVRWWGAGYLLPHAPEIHERVWLRQLELLRSQAPHPERDVDFGYYPQIPVRIALWTQPSASHDAPRTAAEHATACARDLLHLRRVGALGSACIVPATWLLARAFLGPGAALLAAAFAAGSVLHVFLSQHARPHAAGAAASTIALVAALALARRPSWRTYFGAGAAFALALSVLQSALAVGPALLAAHWVRARSAGEPGWRGVLVLAALPLAAVPVAYPFLLAASSGQDAATLAAGEQRLDFSGHRVFLDQFTGQGFAALARALANYDPLLLGAACAGAVAAVFLARRRARELDRRALVVVAAFALPYTLVVGAYDVTYERFALPLVPLLAMSGAFAVESVRPAKLRALAGLVAVVAALAPSARLAHVHAQRDTQSELAAWIETRPADDARPLWLAPSLDVPLVRDSASLALVNDAAGPKSLVWLRYQSALGDEERARVGRPIATLFGRDAAGAQRAIDAPEAFLDGLGRARIAMRLDLASQRLPLRRLHESLQARGRLVARFSPYDSEQETRPFDYADDWQERRKWWFGLLWRAQRPGPVIEVFELP